ncbi:hypothetical protein ABUE31_13015 [Mesorhizobium sp. ZMM04-5]|uniref:Sulfotransferase domain-containing protein n=1 Tax=Mesorhizobium marinum TaxID=3228790 RepID=A0ABV3R1J5_9HYPH
MQISLHIGPHKTGTTSIQTFLLDRYGGSGPRSIWYPAPTDRGPGHSRLALDHIRGGRLLENLVAVADAAGVRHLILSSEDFSFADAGALNRLCFLSKHDVRLLVTINSPQYRIPSLWQEMVKHGSTKSLAEAIDQIFGMPGMRPDFVSSFASGLNPKEVAIIHVSRSEPRSALIENFCAAIELIDNNYRQKDMNESFGYLEVELVRKLNLILSDLEIGSDMQKSIRALCSSSMRSDEWRKIVNEIGIHIDGEYIEKEEMLSKLIYSDIESVAKMFETRVLGDRGALFEGGQHKKHQALG